MAQPEGILNLSKKWGIPPNRLVMVGDMDSDIGAGKNAGSITIGVTSGFYTNDMMKKVNPDYIFTDVNYCVGEMFEFYGGACIIATFYVTAGLGYVVTKKILKGN